MFTIARNDFMRILPPNSKLITSLKRSMQEKMDEAREMVEFELEEALRLIGALRQ
jgi:hypothetical protein